jgi:hypothetical protein
MSLLILSMNAWLQAVTKANFIKHNAAKASKTHIQI